ncbi:MAG: c-type cytochrome [Mesorhizobium sp.]
MPLKHAHILVAACLLALPAKARADDLQALVDKGKAVATAADCMACHTIPQTGKPFAGGYAIASPLGTIYSSNITPSKKAGIGDYSEADFERAVRKGVRKDGAHLYPAMPYDAYAGVTDEDVHALYAYFMHGVVQVDEAPRRGSRHPRPVPAGCP